MISSYATLWKDTLTKVHTVLNMIIIFVYENFFLKFSQNFLSKARLKTFSQRQPIKNYLRISQNRVYFRQGER